MYCTNQSHNRNRLRTELIYRSFHDTLKKPYVVYCKVPDNPNEEFRRSSFNVENESHQSKDHYFCHMCRQNKDFETSLAIFSKCFHDYCSNCYFKIAQSSTSVMCPVCGENVGKVLITDRRYKPSIRTRLLEELPTNTPGSNVCSLIKNFGKKIEAQNLLFCPFKLNGCEQKLTLPLPLSNDLDPNELDDFVSHLINNHNMFICGLCIFRNQFLPIHVTFYNEQEFINHMQSIHVNPTSSNSGIDKYRHAVCPFCESAVWFVDQKSLLSHCKQSHLECDICHEVYAATSENMIKHYRKDHALCQFCQKPFALDSYVDHLHKAHPIESKTLRQQILDNTEIGDSLLKKFNQEEIKQLSLSGLASDDVWNPSSKSDTKDYMRNFPSIDGKAQEVVPPPVPSSTVFYKTPYCKASSYSAAFPSLSDNDGKLSDKPMIGSSAAAVATATTSTPTVDKKETPTKWSNAVKKTMEQIKPEAYPSLTKPKPTAPIVIQKSDQTKPEEPKVEQQRWATMIIDNEQFRFKMAKPKIHSDKQKTEAKSVPPELSSFSDFPDLKPKTSAPKPSEQDPAKKEPLKKIDWTAEVDWKSFCEPKEEPKEEKTRIRFTINPPIDEDNVKKDKARGNVGKSLAQKEDSVLPSIRFAEFPSLDPILNAGGGLQMAPNRKATMPAQPNKGNSGGDAKNAKKGNKKQGDKK